MREHLNIIWQKSGKKPDLLENAAELPELADHVWRYFLELHSERGNNGMGASKITSSGILDWQEVEGIRLRRWEIRAIRLIDNAWMKSQQKPNE